MVGIMAASLEYFFADTATAEIDTLTLHDAVPMSAEYWAELMAAP